MINANAVVPAIDTGADVVLSDGSSISIKVRVTFNATTQPESVVKTAVTDWVIENNSAHALTLSKLVNDLNYSASLIQKLKGLRDSSSASVVGITVSTPPIEAFAEKSKQVTAILKSGETVRLTFGAPPGPGPAAPGGFEVSKAYELLASLQFSQLSTMAKLLNDKLLPPNNGWQYLVLGLEQLSCPCPHS